MNFNSYPIPSVVKAKVKLKPKGPKSVSSRSIDVSEDKGLIPAKTFKNIIKLPRLNFDDEEGWGSVLQPVFQPDCSKNPIVRKLRE